MRRGRSLEPIYLYWHAKGLIFARLLSAFLKVNGYDAILGSGTRILAWPKISYLRGSRISIGRGCIIGKLTIGLQPGAELVLGERVSINDGFFINAMHRVAMGSDVLIAEYVSIRDHDHDFSDTTRPIKTQGFVGAPVEIGDDVWIGRGVAILKGVRIGRGAVIGANAVVTKEIPPYAIAVGIPARVIRYRDRTEQAA